MEVGSYKKDSKTEPDQEDESENEQDNQETPILEVSPVMPVRTYAHTKVYTAYLSRNVHPSSLTSVNKQTTTARSLDPGTRAVCMGG